MRVGFTWIAACTSGRFCRRLITRERERRRLLYATVGLKGFRKDAFRRPVRSEHSKSQGIACENITYTNPGKARRIFLTPQVGHKRLFSFPTHQVGHGARADAGIVLQRTARGAIRIAHRAHPHRSGGGGGGPGEGASGGRGGAQTARAGKRGGGSGGLSL